MYIFCLMAVAGSSIPDLCVSVWCLSVVACLGACFGWLWCLVFLRGGGEVFSLHPVGRLPLRLFREGQVVTADPRKGHVALIAVRFALSFFHRALFFSTNSSTINIFSFFQIISVSIEINSPNYWV